MEPMEAKSLMKWTTPSDLVAQVRKLWDRGLLLSSMAGGEPVFPRRLVLKGPDSRELSDKFSMVQDWIAKLSAASGPYRLLWRSVNHRILGTNDIPSEVWIDTLEAALGLIGKRKDAQLFSKVLELTRQRQPELLPWLEKRPLRALELVTDWPQILSMVAWLNAHPRPAMYLRQIDLPGIHTKWIEGHRAVLAELFDLVLPLSAVDAAHTGVTGFCRRYGFLDKPPRVRFRLLDPHIRLLDANGDPDITLTQDAFSSLDLPVSRVFITENEINFLVFPEMPEAMVIFGAGYGFENLASAAWLGQKPVWYWGDIDTHGFAILNQLRKNFPHAMSFLMDEETLLSHQNLWSVETKPETGELTRLTDGERLLYDALRNNHWREGVRLEQERIGFDFLKAALKRL